VPEVRHECIDVLGAAGASVPRFSTVNPSPPVAMKLFTVTRYVVVDGTTSAPFTTMSAPLSDAARILEHAEAGGRTPNTTAYFIRVNSVGALDVTPSRCRRNVIILEQGDATVRSPDLGANMRVLLCADGLTETTSAMSWLERMSPREPSVLHIAATAQAGPLALQGYESFEALRHRIVEGSRQLGEFAAGRLEEHFSEVVVRVAEGDPHEQLLKAAADSRAELVIVGLPGDRQHSPSPGTLARFAAHQLECSVLLAAGAPDVVRTIVLGIDGSPSAREAARIISLTGLTSAPDIFALGVVDTSWRRTIDLAELTAAIQLAIQAVEAQQAEDTRGALKRGTAVLSGRVNLDSAVVSGNPLQALLDTARDRSADLIAVGHQGLGSVRRLSLGSVTADLVAAPPCSLLIGRR
jgi:nucleotide-binding universal stress UspA family protein